MTQKARPVFYVITLLLPLLILAGIEGGLRLIGFGQAVPLVIESDSFPGYSQPNPSYIQRYFPLPEMAPAVSPDTVFFRTDKAPSSIRIVIQGGSTAAGFPYGCWALDEQLYGDSRNAMVVDQGIGRLHVRLAPFESLVYKTGGSMPRAPENDLTMVAPADPVCAAVLTQRLKHEYDDKL